MKQYTQENEMKSYLNTQFECPSGFCGTLVGFGLANLHKGRLDWTVETLDIRDNDHILEIGFGPGTAIEQVSALATNGFVAGVDPSSVMVRQAQRRNRNAIRTGRVELQRKSVADLPYEDACFDKVFAINSYHHWPEPQGSNLKEILRVLKPGGKVFITEQPHWVANEIEAVKIAERYKGELVQSGFGEVEIEARPIEQGLCFIIKGVK
jgi:ubiquinone/menaquinone biosynthesis C-methylase UbiE